MRSCNSCARMRPDDVEECPYCHNHANCYVPDLAEIAAGCLRVQSTWTPNQEAAHRQIRNPEAEVATISQHPRGRRVMRGHDHDR